MAKIHKLGLANSLLDSLMATWLTLTGTLPLYNAFMWAVSEKAAQSELNERPCEAAHS